MKVVLDTGALQKIKIFQTISPVNVMDCIEDEDTVYFVVKGDSKPNFSRNMHTIRRAEHLFRKRVRIFEFSNDPRIFMKRVVPEAVEIDVETSIARIKVKNCFKPRVIGKDKKNLIIIKSLLKRFFDIEDVKIM